MWQFLIDLLFPLECLGCRREGFWLCETCFRQLKLADQEKNNNLIIPDLTKIFIAGDYEDVLLRAAIKKFKYNFISGLGEPLARFLNLFWSGVILTRPDLAPLIEPRAIETTSPLLIPIPLSKKRLRWRGFNQAEILTRALNQYFSYPLNLQLKREYHSKPQATLNENERLKNLLGAFTWTGKNLNDRIIILIDDVVTTGTTLNEAAKILKAAGAGKIYGLVLAKG